MIRILHTADVHLGAKLGWLEDKSKDHRRQLLLTFENIINKAIELKVNILAIAGDLFDTSFPSSTTVAYVQTLLDKLSDAGIYTFILPGNHDRLERGSVYENFLTSNKKVFVMNTGDEEKYDIQELNISVFGKGIVSQYGNKSPLQPLVKKFQEEKNMQFNIALLHGAVKINSSHDFNYPIEPDEISASGFDYIALGDWHGLKDVSAGGTKAFYCGAPELLAIDQQNSGDCILATINNDGVAVEPIKIGKISVESIEIDISDLSGGLESGTNFVQRRIMSILNENASATVVKLATIKGYKSINTKYNLEEIVDIMSAKYYYVKIKDESQFALSDDELAKYPQELVIGRFINEVKKEIEKEPDAIKQELLKEVLQEGVIRLAA